MIVNHCSLRIGYWKQLTSRRYSGHWPGGSHHETVSMLPVGWFDRTVCYSTTTLSDAERPKVSGEYISSALVGGTTKWPGVVARAT